MKQKLLNRNEILQGPAPACLRAIKNFRTEHAAQYIDGYRNSLLIPELAKHYGLEQEHFIVSYGSEDLLRWIFNSCRPGKDSVLCNEFHFTYYDHYARHRKIKLDNFRLAKTKTAFAFDLKDCLVQYKKHDPKIIIITSPNSPTGNSISPKDLRAILKKVSKKTLVVIDESYYGFNKAYSDSAAKRLIKAFPNLVFSRTFSKTHALAGMRIAYALCGTRVKQLLGYDHPYLGVSRILEQVAIAALRSKKYYKNLANEIISLREFFIKETNRLAGFHAFKSDSSFVLIEADQNLVENFKKRLASQPAVIAKHMEGNYFRVSLSLAVHARSLISVMRKLGQRRP